MRAWLFLLLVFVGLGAAPAGAMESAAVVSTHATVTLVTEADSVVPGHPLRIGLHFRLAPGWHIYWQNPGDAGAAPELSLTLPPGVRTGPIAWPAPQRLTEGPLTTFAYTGEVLLPLSLTATAPGRLEVAAHADWLVCGDVCVPESGDFHVSLPQGAGKPSAQAALFQAADRRIPRPAPWPVHIAPDGTLWVADKSRTPPVREAWFYPIGSGTVDASAPQELETYDGGFSLALHPGQSFEPGQPLAGVLELRDADGSSSAIAVNATPAPVPEAASGDPWRVPRILGLALLGGLILNLMPCVFPVLAMKAIGLARLGGAERRQVRLHAISYTAGVLVAFLALGGALLALRAAGSAAGWGFQFQTPAFVAGVAWLLFAVGMNLSGVYQVGVRLTGAGQGLTEAAGHAGSFCTGLLAVLVATPCTAPFMAAAIGAALTESASVTLAVFAALGLGLAAPYALLAILPRAARVLPRPGRWMEILRQALAFPMYGATAWLVWVVAQEAGPTGVLGTAAGLVLLGFAGWVLGIAQTATGHGRAFGHWSALAATLAALAVLPGIAGGTAPVRSADAEAYSPSRLAALHAAGQPVFVNMTAAWCVTCLVNERLALSPAPVQQAFAAHHVAYLKGDWTRQNPDITEFLHAHGRDGVPLYVLYPAGNAAPIVLPQILTEETMLAAVAK